jgi:8-oxo-dGTP diphosphatase
LRLVVVAACALIDAQGRVLIAERPKGKSMAGLWEFPGGKVEADERPEKTVVREMREELGVSIDESTLSPFIFASHTYPDFHLLMPLFLCRQWEGEVSPREGQKVAWVPADELDRYPMPPADAPLIPMLKELS